MKLLDNILNLIFPPTCGICGKITEEHICKDCYKKLQPYLYFYRCEDIFYALKYKELIRSKIIDYKFNDKAYLYNMFCEILIRNKMACEFIKEYDIIIPVPMHKRKKARRGYNQTELVAKQLARKFDIPISTTILIKQKNTPMQSSLGREDRIKNVQNVYKIDYEEKITDKKVLLVDDIYTTGATVTECKKMLKLAGAKKVGAIIIAED